VRIAAFASPIRSRVKSAPRRFATASSTMRWFGLALHANAFQLSRAIFDQRDVRHIGKRLLTQVCAGTVITQLGSSPARLAAGRVPQSSRGTDRAQALKTSGR
jgi:hypothetical protein